MSVKTEFSDEFNFGIKVEKQPADHSVNNRDTKKVGSFMRRDKRKNAKPKDNIQNPTKEA